MAAPSFLYHPDEMGRYADMEARHAYRIAVGAELDAHDVRRASLEVVADRWHEIRELRDRLLAEGRVEFAARSRLGYAPKAS